MSALAASSSADSGSSISNSRGCDSSARPMRDALAFAAGEIARRAVEQRREAAEVDHLVQADAPAPAARRPAARRSADWP